MKQYNRIMLGEHGMYIADWCNAIKELAIEKLNDEC